MPDLTDERYDKHREAGSILADVRAEAVEMVDVGASHLELVETVEDRIRELGGEPAFPVNISVDEEAAHGTPGIDDAATFGEELINLDVGVHVDGWIADSAITVDLSGNPDHVEAVDDALDRALELVEPGVEAGEIGAAVEETIEGYDLNPVVNLTGHGLGEYEQHTDPTIPNRAVGQSATLEAGDVVAIEPFATDGSGKVSEGSRTEIYALDREQSVRDRRARQALEEITERFRTLPFATRWLESSRPEMSLKRLERQDVIHGYPVLSEDEGYLVSQKEHTVIVTEDGCEVTTRA
ncbi:type II methionyl aminopeptidase [Halococcoides cellulosivorans]|uniref:Methionine aminopeptidase n=1 Tax=Halococcoides cellulosivorans TaxID=1679096 RepID=A0A2R4WYK1_9EURY|nr:type II methionyl aminopeptidase [Halococcoides cellulosivorans]AWB26611.1 type II methionyl aminopeptidase [Halococcoides cellulosivorans]